MERTDYSADEAGWTRVPNVRESALNSRIRWSIASPTSFLTDSSSSTSLTATSVISTNRSTIPTLPRNADCPNEEDYSPCVCVPNGELYYNLVCDNVSMEETNQVFSRTTPAEFISFKITTDDKTIPNDLMHLSQAREIALNCMSGDFETLKLGNLTRLSPMRLFHPEILCTD